AVISPTTGHIFTHETGAVEATGHKIITIPTEDGKLTVSHVETLLLEHTDHHMVSPKMVYISNPTEIGTVYTKDELTALHDFCCAQDLIFYIDGARLASALALKEPNVTLKDLPLLCDAFYIGGTKCGALFGEALVIVNKTLAKNFNFSLKQRGGLFAKGRILGIQFKTLFKNNLYLELGAHANHLADRLRGIFEEAGFTFLIDSPTNQLFPILPNTLIDALRKDFVFRDWSICDKEHTVVRFVTSWAMTDEMIDTFSKRLKQLLDQ
ncbi:MAG: beta-eliminating lyase-related protein, partial [Eubacterium sp.]